MDLGLKERLKTIQSAMVALMREEWPEPSPGWQLQETCRKWNSMGCSFPRCKQATRAAAVGTTTQPADAVLGPRRAAEAGSNRPYWPVLSSNKQ